MQQEMFKRCGHCGSVLQWPGVELTRVERIFFDVIKRCQEEGKPVSGGVELLRIAGHKCALASARAIISKINDKIRPVGIVIIPRPYRILQITGYPATHTVK